MSAQSQLVYDATAKQTTIIFCQSKRRCQDLEIIAKACDCAVLSPRWHLGSEADIEGQPEADYLLIELLSISDKAEQSLTEIVRYLHIHRRSRLLLWTDMDMLETAYASLPVERCHFLLNASDVEAMPILTGAQNRMIMDELHDQGHRADYGSLHRISDELAEFARTLAKMAETEIKSGVADKPVSFRAAPPSAFQRFVTGTNGVDPEISAASIREIIKIRRMRDSFFDAALFADPAWDILLDLMAAKLEGQQVSVSSLCIAAAVPATTALRWISSMTENGLLVREHDPEDARRVFITLSADAEEKLRGYLIAAQKRPSL
jgi:DNA-binding MarR family transcriptional regulator